MKVPNAFMRAIGGDPGCCILLVGAGASATAVRLDGQGLPTWHDLMRQMIDELRDEQRCDPATLTHLQGALAEGRYLEIAEAYGERTRPDEFLGFLRDKLDPPDIIPDSQLHRLVLTCGFRGILTTNLDCVFERQRSGPQSVLVYPDLLSHIDAMQQPRFFAKIHGCVRRSHDPARDIILTRASFENLRADRRYQELLRAAFLWQRVLCVGFSLRDPDFLGIVDDLHATYGESLPTIYALMLNPGIEAGTQWRKHGIGIIPYADHKDVTDFFDDLTRIGRPRRQSPIFRDTVEVEELPELPTIAGKRPHCVMISGSGDKGDYNRLCRSLGFKLARFGFAVITGGSPAVGRIVSTAAWRHYREHLPQDEIPVFIFRRQTSPYRNPPGVRCVRFGTDYSSYRRQMVLRAHACVFIGGYEGTIQEFEYADQAGRLLVPVGATGRAARSCWTAMNDGRAATSRHRIGRKEWIALGDANQPQEELANIILRVLIRAREEEFGPG